MSRKLREMKERTLSNCGGRLFAGRVVPRASGGLLCSESSEPGAEAGKTGKD